MQEEKEYKAAENAAEKKELKEWAK